MMLALAMTLFTAHAQELNAGPYIQQASPSSVWILWETTDSDPNIVYWGETSALGESTLGSRIPTSGDAEVHEVELTGLEPDTRYY